jgi:hypothetical protein
MVSKSDPKKAGQMIQGIMNSSIVPGGESLMEAVRRYGLKHGLGKMPHSNTGPRSPTKH